MAKDGVPDWNSKTCHMGALVLARGGSEGIKMKNIRPCGGIPLLAWVLRAIRDSQIFDSVWVSTDHDDIAEVAIKYGAQVHRRSAEVSTSQIKSIETTQEFLKYHPEIEMVGHINCTMPTLRPEHLQDVSKLIREQGYEAVFSVTRLKDFMWKEVTEGGVTEPLNFDPNKRPSRKDFKGELIESGSFYFTRSYLLRQGSFQAGNMTYYETPAEEHVDIDTEFDLLLADKAVRKFGYKPRGEIEGA